MKKRTQVLSFAFSYFNISRSYDSTHTPFFTLIVVNVSRITFSNYRIPKKKLFFMFGPLPIWLFQWIQQRFELKKSREKIEKK